MKFFSFLILSALVAGVASADPVVRDHRPDHPNRPRPVPAPAPVPAPVPQPVPTYPEAKGRVHRLALTLEHLSTQTSSYAQQLFDTGMYGDRLTDEEVDAVAQLSFVREASLQFRAAVDAEGAYNDNPVQSQRAYLWLHRAYTLVERNRVIGSRHELGSYIAQMGTTMQQLRAFYAHASRYGWSLAEVILLGEEMELEVNAVYDLVQREVRGIPGRDRGRDHRDPRNRDPRDRDPRGDREERQFMGQLMRLQGAVRQFVAQARQYNNAANARHGLQDEFARLRQTFQSADWRLDRLRFSPAVKQGFDRVEFVYRDLELAFRTVR